LLTISKSYISTCLKGRHVLERLKFDRFQTFRLNFQAYSVITSVFPSKLVLMWLVSPHNPLMISRTGFNFTENMHFATTSVFQPFLWYYNQLLCVLSTPITRKYLLKIWLDLTVHRYFIYLLVPLLLVSLPWTTTMFCHYFNTSLYNVYWQGETTCKHIISAKSLFTKLLNLINIWKLNYWITNNVLQMFRKCFHFNFSDHQINCGRTL
jgi:hypothetical protein